jgi:hypothetical protein
MCRVVVAVEEPAALAEVVDVVLPPGDRAVGDGESGL